MDWKIGKSFQKGYVLKIKCVEKSEAFSQNLREEMYRLFMFKKGTALLNINDRHMVITSPSALCLSDKDVIYISGKSEYELNIIYFHPSVINYLFDCENVVSGDIREEWTQSTNQDRFLLLPFFERKGIYNGCLKVEVNAFNKMIQLFSKLQHQMISEIDENWPCRSRSYFIEILIMLQMKYLDNSDTKEFLELKDSERELNYILDYIHSSYSKKITIDMLTKKFNINRNTLNQRFNELTGYTPISYLIKHRLRVAESILVNTQVPVNEICERVGFNELSNFIRSFKKQYGDSPANYRNKYSTM